MLNKSKQKQKVTGSEAFSILGVLCLVSYVFVYILASNGGNKKLETAKIEMESLSAQIMAAGMKSLPGQGLARGLASVPSEESPVKWVQDWSQVGSEGKIGRDPWGQPFHYLVIKENAQKAKYIVIISGGPNKQLETPVEKASLVSGKSNLMLSYVGDDFGLVRPIP
ncbi:MAG: type II secretion system protein GspG [Bdellovibrionales bacterium]